MGAYSLVYERPVWLTQGMGLLQQTECRRGIHLAGIPKRWHGPQAHRSLCHYGRRRRRNDQPLRLTIDPDY